MQTQQPKQARRDGAIGKAASWALAGGSSRQRGRGLTSAFSTHQPSLSSQGQESMTGRGQQFLQSPCPQPPRSHSFSGCAGPASVPGSVRGAGWGQGPVLRPWAAVSGGHRHGEAQASANLLVLTEEGLSGESLEAHAQLRALPVGGSDAPSPSASGSRASGSRATRFPVPPSVRTKPCLLRISTPRTPTS